MNKIMVAVAGLALAVALTGCGGSPKSVAAKFAEAVAKRDTDRALGLTAQAAYGANIKIMKSLSNKIEGIGRDDINDPMLEAAVYSETVFVPKEDVGYDVINGAKVTPDWADVVIQYVKGKDKKPNGMNLRMKKVDGKWRVKEFSYKKDGLETLSE